MLGKPYTRTGDIVIAANPYQWLTHLYKEEVQLDYANKLVWDRGDGDNRKVMEPHIYETSALSYKGLACSDMSQSILVSGESGAGKWFCLVDIAVTALPTAAASQTLLLALVTALRQNRDGQNLYESQGQSSGRSWKNCRRSS